MLHFFYDSLDTLKKVKKPTVKEIKIFTLQVFIAVLVGSVLFFVLDNFWGNIYKLIYQTFGGSISQVAPLDASAPLPIPSTSPTDTQATPPVDATQPSAENDVGVEVVPTPAPEVPVPAEPTPAT